jgi:membrane protein YdbS with pleckstrin-like domain
VKIRNLIGGAGVAVCGAAWIAVAVGYFIGVGLATWTVLVTIAAVSIEVMFWALAVMLGLTVIQARRKIWRWMTGRGLATHGDVE